MLHCESTDSHKEEFDKMESGGSAQIRKSLDFELVSKSKLEVIK
jgi:hypothetical protein